VEGKSNRELLIEAAIREAGPLTCWRCGSSAEKQDPDYKRGFICDRCSADRERQRTRQVETRQVETERGRHQERGEGREEVLDAAGFHVVKVAQGWAVRPPGGGLLEWEDGSPRIKATREAALDMAAGTLRYTRAAANTFGLENG
jgi:hypothetical protein